MKEETSINNKYFEKLENNINYKFKDKKLLKMAMTHSSYVNDNKMKKTNIC